MLAAGLAAPSLPATAQAPRTTSAKAIDAAARREPNATSSVETPPIDRREAIDRAAMLINNIRARLDACGNKGMLALQAPDGNQSNNVSVAASAESKRSSVVTPDARSGTPSPIPKRPALRYNARLEAAASGHAQAMATSGFFDHVDLEGATVGKRVTRTGYKWRIVGENLAAGHHSIDEAVQGWLLSTSHCEVMLDARFTEFGIATHASHDAHDLYGVYWTLVVAAP